MKNSGPSTLHSGAKCHLMRKFEKFRFCSKFDCWSQYDQISVCNKPHQKILDFVGFMAN